MCTTRWSSHADATDALINVYLIFKELIKQFIENKDCYLNAISLNEAKWLFNKFNNLETSLFTVIWNTILERINRTSKELQSTSLDLNTAVILLKSMHSYIYKLRDEFNNLEKKAKQLGY